ncbi:MAG: glycosyltransferase family 39 protein [bacterium]|nr:glycosyltransferase family 39 protein [bacterium]
MDQDVWFDEAVILFQIEKTFPQIWNFCKLENFPPLFSWALKVWALPSANLTWLRLLDVLLGSAIPPIIYLWGRDLAGKKAGFIIGLTCVMSLPLIYYSQVIRMYSLFVFIACFSYFAFLRAIESDKYKYWILVAIANLLGFYSFLFMVFIIVAQAFILIVRYRLQLSRYLRPLLVHLPIFALMLFWVVPILNRYSYMQTSFGPYHVTWNDLIEYILFLGTGTKFNKNYLLAFLINLPILIGFLLSVPIWLKKTKIQFPAFLFVSSILMVAFISIVSQTLFYNRYLLFLVPVYLTLAVLGWLNQQLKLVRLIGITLMFLSLSTVYVYYNLHFLDVHEDFRYLWSRLERTDGHSFSKMSHFVQDNIKPGEVIIHYSNANIGQFSYFPFLYYHKRQLPEFLYSKSEIPQYSGQQYLKPGEWISDFNQLQPAPKGVWLVTFQNADAIVNPEYFMEGGIRGRMHKENLPKDLYFAGYRSVQKINIGGITSIHFLPMSQN